VIVFFFFLLLLIAILPLDMPSRTSSKTVLAYKLSPKQRATNIIEELVIDVNDLSTLKDILFSLRYSVKDSAFAEEFIAQNGLTRLVEVIEIPFCAARTFPSSLLRIPSFSLSISLQMIQELKSPSATAC
jgi:hypothetical protein